MTRSGHDPGAFLHWARRIAESVDLTHDEHDFKKDLARQLGEARLLVLADTPEWPEAFRKAVNKAAGILSPFFLMSVTEWLRGDAGSVRAAILALWGDDQPSVTAIDAFSAGLASLGKRATPGNRRALAAVLLMARQAEVFPPYAVEAIKKAVRLWGYPDPPSAPDSAAYQHALEFFDEVLSRAAAASVPISNRLEAQGVVWTVVKYDPGPDWSAEEQADFLSWRDGKAGDTPAPGPRAWLVRGSSVLGVDLTPTWRADGFVSLAAAQLPALDFPAEPLAIRAAVDEGYGHLSYAKREEKIRDIRSFLLTMQPDDLVITTSGGKVYVGAVEGEPEQLESEGGRSNLRRPVAWAAREEPVDFADLPSELTARLKGGSDVVDLTEVISHIEALLPAERQDELEPVPPSPPAQHLALRHLTDAEADTLLVAPEWLDELVDLLNAKRQVILYGPPGTGKTYLAQKVANAVCVPENVRLVQFHPAYSYEDFFEGYRPVPGDDGRVAFALKAGPFRRIVEDAREHPERPYVLIVDEINRANLAKVFGELYFLLEYREEAIDLLYSEEDSKQFSLPKNVYLIGTMNTADRSIALVDAAMRRRFAFLSLHPDDEHLRPLLRTWLQRKGLPTLAADLLDELNRLIEDRDVRIGPSYLMTSAVADEAGLARIWRTAILPLLEEHHYGDESVNVARRYGLEGLLRRVTADQPPPSKIEEEAG